MRSRISARVYHRKKRYKFTTGISVPTALWLDDNSGVKTGAQIVTKNGITPITAQNINDTLLKIQRSFAIAWNEELKNNEFTLLDDQKSFSISILVIQEGC
jgi:hypothetical protein